MNRMVSVMAGAAHRTARRAGSSLLLLAVVLLPVALLTMAGCEEEATPPTFPTPVPPQPQNWLFEVKGTGPGNIYACGNKGAMFRYDGAAWTAMNMQTSDPIVAMWADPANPPTIYAVGHGGRIWRNTGGTWNRMESGTTRNLYAVGSFGGVVHAVGHGGAMRRLNGGTWNGVAGRMLILDENGAPTDTLEVAEDIASLLMVNHHFVGGAFLDPEFEGRRLGTEGTRGMVVAANTDVALGAPWILRLISGEQRVPDEWVLCTNSDPATLSRNLLGTSEGWLFRLTIDEDGKNVWTKTFPSLTSDPRAGINDLWLDAAGNVYMVTDDGQIVWQSADYDFVAETGERRVLYDERARLTAIWGTAPDNIYVCGFMEEKILHVSHDPATHAFDTTEIPLAFADKASVPARGVDHLGRPLD